jgi:bifunctional enzyme CysN/CysC
MFYGAQEAGGLLLISASAQQPHDLLRILTAGSVDDGKSTLIGRLLRDSGGVYEDELASLLKTSEKNGSGFDPSLITDGLKAEREQGITIDVAYRYFSTSRRQFIIADTPGHEQYTRNMVTGASTAQVAVLLMDARKGVLSQTCRHVYIAWLLGIRTLLIAVNKMDLVEFSQDVFERHRRSFLEFTTPLQFQDVKFIPISAFAGDNVTAKSARMPWYQGCSLLETLECIEVSGKSAGPFRLPVQTVIRTQQDFRGYAGQIVSGNIHRGQEVRLLPSGKSATIEQIRNYTRELDEAWSPMSVVITLRQHIDLGRGDLLCDPDHPPFQTRRFQARLIWMSDSAMKIGMPYLIKHTTQTACMSIARLLHKTDIHTLEKVEADVLLLNEIGEVEVETHKPVFCDAYANNRTTGSFIVIDPTQNITLAAGMISRSLEEHQEDHAVPFSSVSKQQALAVWFTGLSGAGKTTICEAVYMELLARGIRVEMLDGDVVRKHLSRELGFSKPDRDENIRRMGFVARLLTRNGVIALVSAISPYRAVRNEIRANIGTFLEVFVNAPLEVCERRDPKGLYKRAHAGEFQGFTGVDDPYEPPLSPEVECRTDRESIKESVDRVVTAILKTLQSQ